MANNTSKLAPKVKAKEPVTYAEFLQQEWVSFGVHHVLEADNIPDSNYPFAVGEEVRVGNLPECKQCAIDLLTDAINRIKKGERITAGHGDVEACGWRN